ncbi:hypothetical protein HK105_205370 [Polyrhizophydium stewartii]|uniref:Ankyrin repeat protein n=1 Tax=Polyrhizophydium stewartii TaxID=2732419 RepID=A0ABR4N6A1_9FUNG
MPAEIQNKILSHSSPFTKFVNGLLLAAELRGMPEKQREHVWQDASDADWQGDLDLLPPIDIASKSLNIRSRSFLERCHNRFDRSFIVRVAVRNGWTDLFDFEHPELLAVSAAREGALDVLVDLIDVRKIAKPTTQLAVVAAEKGHLAIVKFVHERMPGGQWGKDVANAAAKSGNLDPVVWLKEHHPECFGPEAYPVQLDRNILTASDVRVLEWLRERSLLRVEGVYVHIARAGNIEAYEWVKQRYGFEMREDEITNAYQMRQNDFIKHLYSHGLPLSKVSAAFAVAHCNTEIMNWAISRDRGVIPMVVEESAKFGQPVLIEWWRVRHGIVFGQQEFVAAAQHGNTEVVKHMIAADSGELDLEAALAASTQAAGPFNLIEATQGILRYAIANRAAKPK